MPVSNGRFSKPIRLKEDLANFFGLSANLGNIIVNGNINKYSKHKPYRYNTRSELTEQNKKDINYGMTTFNFDLSTLASAANLNRSFVWEQWGKPRGNTYNEPYRGLDFDGYNHYAVPFITGIEMYNSESGGKLPIVTDGQSDDRQFGYYGKITFDNNADLKLTDFWTSAGQYITDYYLTLIIGANISGLDNDYSFFAQSEKTVGEAVSNGDTSMQVYLDTTSQKFKEAIVNTNIGKNIVLLAFAKKWSSVGQNAVLSPQMWDNSIPFYLYNDTYATIGDGDEGGQPVGYIVYGHMSLGTNTPYIEIKQYDSNNIGIFYSQGNYPRLIMTSGQIANGILASLKFDYQIRNSDGSGGTIQGGVSFTTTELISSNTQNQVYVDGPSGVTGLVGLINKSFFGNAGQYTAQVRISVSYRANSSAQSISLRSDGQLQGIQTEWQTITFNYNG